MEIDLEKLKNDFNYWVVDNPITNKPVEVVMLEEVQLWLAQQQVKVEPEVIKTEADTVNTVSANQRAKRWAMMNFDKWNEVTGFVDPHISYYDEITALIEDAVEFGYGVALKQPLKEIMKVIKKSEGSL